MLREMSSNGVLQDTSLSPSQVFTWHMHDWFEPVGSGQSALLALHSDEAKFKPHDKLLRFRRGCPYRFFFLCLELSKAFQPLSTFSLVSSVLSHSPCPTED